MSSRSGRKSPGRYGGSPVSPSKGGGRVSPLSSPVGGGGGGGGTKVSTRAREMAEEKRARKAREEKELARNYRQKKARALEGRKKRKKRNPVIAALTSCVSRKEQVVMTIPTAQQAVELLDLSQRDLRRLKYLFDDIDADQTNEIDYQEFFELFGEKRSPYTDALFQFIDLDGSGTIDFDE
eukprot:g6053.t1